MTQSKAFVPLKPIPVKDRVSMIFIQYGRINVKDGAFAVVDEVNGERLLILAGSQVDGKMAYRTRRPAHEHRQTRS